MSEGLENSENSLGSQNQYLYGGFQRVSSYDPNMCTTAARFSPFYGKSNLTQPRDRTKTTYKNLICAPNNEDEVDNVTTVDASKIVDRSYLTYNNKNLVHQQTTQRVGSVAFNAKESATTTLGSDVGIGIIQQIPQESDGVTGEPMTSSIVLHRSPKGHLYQNFYVTNENGTPGEIVELIPIGSNDVTHLSDDAGKENYALQSYEFTTECHMDTLEETQQIDSEENEEHQRQIFAAQLMAQQRILLESTMSPLLAAVNDVTQRDAELLSYLNQHVEKDDPVKLDEERNEFNSICNGPTRYSSDEDDDYILVSDKPIESRARATLPTNYLYLGPINSDTNEPSVFAKKAIPQRTKFGPFEGEIQFTSEVFLNILRSQNPRNYPFLFIGKSKILAVTNENNSNWMRYVRLANSYAEQNLQIIEEDNRLFFKCNRDIHAKEELRVGYHVSYAEKYNLGILKPTASDNKKKYESDNPWMCFECDQRFSTSQEIQTHLKIHDMEDASCIISKRKIKRKRTKFKKLSELPKNSSRCLICFKVFMTNASLKKHFALHLAAKKTKTKAVKVTGRSWYKCHLCFRKFTSEQKLEVHQETHSDKKDKPYKCQHCDQQCATATALAAHVRSHTNRLYSCVFCQETFKYVKDFKKHVAQHRIDGRYVCFHCKKNYKEYHLVRKHIRIFHPAVKYPCNECDRLFLHMSFLRRHKATHAKQVSFQCAQCELKFQKKHELKQHVKVFHNVRRKIKKAKAIPEEIPPVNDGSHYLELTPQKKNQDDFLQEENSPNSKAADQQSKFKCKNCSLGFKRRGMLVNHLAKKHPELNIDTIQELNEPILKIQTIFKCPYCSKFYKNNANRKAHILKNHPGMEVPPSLRKIPISNDPNVKTVGCVEADVQKCHLCYKQYGSRIRLVAHYRKEHRNEMIPAMPQNEYPTTEILLEEPCVESVIDIYRPPVSPENKLLKLSSAALELSSIEDRKYFDFLNERSDTTIIQGEENEFVESSSNVELNRLPELFEESISCI